MTAPNIVDVAAIKGLTSAANYLTTSEDTIVENPASSNNVIKLNDIVISNIDGTANADVTVLFNRGNNASYLCKNITIPADASFNLVTKEWAMYLEEGDSISAYASAPSVNFGQRPFKYSQPTGFKKINTYNLPDSSIKDGSQYFNAVTYTGTGASRDITVGFSPDLVWVKNRTSAYQHQVSDSVRGTSTVLYPSATTAEASDPNAVTAFLSDGFTYGSSVNGNQSSASIVAWNWRGSDSAAVTNTDGTITSTVSANPTSGFSVVTFTGTGATGTVGHGLSQAPEIYIRKSRSNVEDWLVYTTLIDGSLDFLRLNTTSPKADSGASLPNATTFEVGAGEANGELLVTYCFHSVEGFSKMGTYTGNGSADGTFVYTGFRPAFVLTKSATEARQWVIIDTSRDPYNLANKNQEITSSAEFTNADDLDILSNGFKPRTINPGANGNGQTIIYMAFAENPFKNSLAR